MSWAFVQLGKNSGVGAVTSLSVTLPGVAAGDVLIAGWSGFSIPAFTAPVSDNKGNTWSSPSYLHNNGNLWCGFAWSQTTTGGSVQVTVTPSSGVYMAMGVTEFSVAASATVSQVSVNNATGSSTTQNSGTAAYSGTNNFLGWGDIMVATSGVPSTSGAWVQGNQYPYNANYEAYVDGYQLNVPTSSSPLAFTGTSTISNTWIAQVLILQEILAAGGRPPAASVVRDRSDSRRKFLLAS